MTRKVSLKKNFALTLTGNFVYGFAQWVMLMVIAKLGTPEMVGRFALATAVTAPIVMFANMNLRSVLAGDAHGRHPFGSYMAVRLSALGAGLLAVLCVVFSYRGDGELALIMLVIGLAKLVEAVSDLFLGLMQQQERMDRMAVSLIVKGALSLALFAAAMRLTGSLLWASCGMLAAWTASLLLNDVGNARSSFERGKAPSFAPDWSKAHLHALYMTALPLGAAALCDNLVVNVPRYFVDGMLGDRGLGFFAAMAYVPIVGARVIHALGNSALPRLARMYADGDARAFRALLLKIVAFGAAVGGAGLVVVLAGGRQLLTLFYRPEYASHPDAFAWIMVASGITYVALFLEYGLTAARVFWVQPFVIASSLAVLAAACAALIPRYGINGAAMAMAAGALVQVAGNLFLVLRAARALEGRKPA